MDHPSAFPTNFNNENNVEFPMSMDVDDSLLLSTADFNRNFSSSEFIAEKSPPNVMQSYDFNGLKMENCDTKYNQYLKGVKSSQEESKPQKNSLIANFDHNVLFDSLKNNNINNNNSGLFLIPQETKFTKDDGKSMITNLHLSSNFDTLFNNSIDNHQMDFESIIPYASETHHDPFQITGNGNFNSSLFNLPDEGMMNCEDLNLNF